MRDSVRLHARTVSVIASLAVMLAPLSALRAQPAINSKPSSSVAATSPESIGRRYSTAPQAGDWDAAARLMHPEATRKFRAMIEPAAKADTSGKMALMFMGVESTSAVATLSDAAFYARVLRNLTSRPGMKEVLAGSQVTIIGHVKEGTDLAHVVYRTRMSVQFINVEKVETMSLRRMGNTWGMLLSGGIEGLAAAFGARSRT